MGTFLVYILKSALCLAAFYLFYRLLLSRETFHHFNRVALLGVLLLSCVLPLVEVSFKRPSEVELPLFSLGQWFHMMAAAPVTEAVPEASRTEVSWAQVLLLVYVVGIAFFVLRSVYSLLRLFALLRSARREDAGAWLPDSHGLCLLVHDRPIAPFSWMRCVVISRKDLQEDGRAILAHELAHIRRGHSWDLLLADLCIFLQWFNPAAWLLKQELQSVHEYEADEAVLASGVKAKEYQLLLIKKAVGTRLYSMANSFNHSKLKKRITMMTKRKSNPWARAKYLYVLPLAAIAVVAFARPEVSGVTNEIAAAKVSDLSAIVQNPAAGIDASMPGDSTAVTRKDGKIFIDGEPVLELPERFPQFPGEFKGLMEYWRNNLNYPDDLREKGVKGLVITQFVVGKDGKIYEVRVLRGIDKTLDMEAVRAIKAMPLWIPAEDKGQKVNALYTMPVSFGIEIDPKTGGYKLNN